MSTSYPGPISFPSPATYSSGSLSPYDIKSISEAIDRAASALRQDERGMIVAQVNESGAGGGLVVRLPQLGPLKPSALATVTIPRAGRFGWSLSGKIAFLASAPPKPVRLGPEIRGFYRLLRHRGSWPPAAAIKALGLWFGFEVRLDG
jgi:hypothetical protein